MNPPAILRTLAARLAFCLACILPAAPAALATQTPTLGSQEQAFVAKATADNSMQITLAQVVRDRSASAQVRAFARRIIEDHNALNEKFTDFSVAKKAHGHAHGATNDEVTRDRLRMQNLDGPALDQAFAGLMVQEHQKIIPLYQRAAKDGSDPKLQRIAQDALPMLREHLQRAQALTGD